LDDLCRLTDDAWHVAIKKTAWMQVCAQIWGGQPPDGTDAEHVFEISRRELMDFRNESTRDAS
jgi:hypothetical protein